MAKTYDNIRIYGDDASGVWVAPKGATSPTSLDDPASPHEELGWLSEDGISDSREEDATSFKAMQGGQVVRRKTTSVEDSLKFQCLEETAATLGLRYKGQKPEAVEGASDVARISVKNQTRNDERAFFVRVVDGDVVKAYVIPTGAVGVGELAHSNGDMTIYEFNVTIIGDYEILTNNPAVVAAIEAPAGG